MREDAPVGVIFRDLFRPRLPDSDLSANQRFHQMLLDGYLAGRTLRAADVTYPAIIRYLSTLSVTFRSERYVSRLPRTAPVKRYFDPRANERHLPRARGGYSLSLDGGNVDLVSC